MASYTIAADPRGVGLITLLQRSEGCAGRTMGLRSWNS